MKYKPEPDPVPHRKRRGGKKPYTIECLWHNDFWGPVKREWRVFDRFTTAERRDQALKVQERKWASYMQMRRGKDPEEKEE